MNIDMKVTKRATTSIPRDEEIKKIQRAVKQAYDNAEKLLNRDDKRESLTYKVKFI